MVLTTELGDLLTERKRSLAWPSKRNPRRLKNQKKNLKIKSKSNSKQRKIWKIRQVDGTLAKTIRQMEQLLMTITTVAVMRIIKIKREHSSNKLLMEAKRKLLLIESGTRNSRIGSWVWARSRDRTPTRSIFGTPTRRPSQSKEIIRKIYGTEHS